MQNITCKITKEGVVLLRAGQHPVGVVREVNGEPVIHFRHDFNRVLSFTDITIIQDNWNQFVEQNKPSGNTLERFRFVEEKRCPECGLTQGHERFCTHA